MGFKYEVDAEMAALSSRPSFHCPGKKIKITLFEIYPIKKHQVKREASSSRK